MGKKRFIDPKKEATYKFSLVHRSQRDPLAADSDAPQRVLLANDPAPSLSGISAEKRKRKKETEREHDIYFDDDYDYMQHLKDRTENEHDWEGASAFLKNSGNNSKPSEVKDQNRAHRVKLPSEVFASEFEEETGLLNKAAPRSGPRLDWDPDIVETLDDAFQHETVLTLRDDEECEEATDDLDELFAIALEGKGEDEWYSDEGREENGDFSSNFDEEEVDEVHSLDGKFSFSEEETKTKFTQYSMSSSVIRRNEQLTMLDDRFDKFMDAYMEENTGGLDMDDIEGGKDEQSEMMKQMVVDFRKSKIVEGEEADFEKMKVLSLDSKNRNGVHPNDKEWVEVNNQGEKWDCESVLSTYSNMYHRPKLIKEISKKKIDLSGKLGIPKDTFSKGLTATVLKELDTESSVDGDFDANTIASRVSHLSIRNKHETLEEKKARKSAFKDFKKERRQEKKANTAAFKEEKVKQERDFMNMRKNVHGNRLL